MLKLPHTLASSSNPVFRFEMARVRRLSGPRSLKIYRTVVFGIALGLVILCWGVLTLGEWNYAHSSARPYAFPSIFFYDAVSATLLGLFCIAMLASLLADFYHMLTTIPSINRQIRDGQWDLLRLTPLREEKIINGIYAAAEIRGWRAIYVEMALRFALIAFIVVMGVLPPEWVVQRGLGYPTAYPLVQAFTSSRSSIGAQSLIIMFLAVAGLGYILEPLWRMRTVLIVGLAASARFRQEASAGVAGVTASLLIRLAQAGLIAALIYFAVYIISSLELPGATTGAVFVLDSALFVAFSACIVGINYLYFRWVKRKALKYLWRWAFRRE